MQTSVLHPYIKQIQEKSAFIKGHPWAGGAIGIFFSQLILIPLFALFVFPTGKIDLAFLGLPQAKSIWLLILQFILTWMLALITIFLGILLLNIGPTLGIVYARQQPFTENDLKKDGQIAAVCALLNISPVFILTQLIHGDSIASAIFFTLLLGSVVAAMAYMLASRNFTGLRTISLLLAFLPFTASYFLFTSLLSLAFKGRGSRVQRSVGSYVFKKDYIDEVLDKQDQERKAYDAAEHRREQDNALRDTWNGWG